MPRRLIAAVANQYVAGNELADGIAVARDLSRRDALATLDLLGEAVSDPTEADSVELEYIAALEAMRTIDLQPHVSVKPSSLGSVLDWTSCTDRVRRIVHRAAEVGGIVNLDMEDSTFTDRTLEMFHELRREGCENVAVVLQARLRRSQDDIEQLAPVTPHVRLCKGIYPEAEAIAYTDAEGIRSSFLQCLELLLKQPSFVAIATHDDRLINAAIAAVARHGRTTDSYEFQTLLGVRERLVGRLLDAGHPVRIYVPYGSRSYEYAIRRMHESPQLVSTVARATILGRMSRSRYS